MRKPSRKLRFILISILTALLLIRFLLMPQMGSYLVLEHELHEAGAIVLLLGSTPLETHGCASVTTAGMRLLPGLVKPGPYTPRHGEPSAAETQSHVSSKLCDYRLENKCVS